MNTALVSELSEGVSGEVVLPGDSAYEHLSNGFVHPGAPALIVLCHDTEDVRKAIRFARDNSLVLSVRSGGHSNAGFCTNEGGIIIDVSALNGVEIVDPGQNLVRVGAGAKWGEAAKALVPHNLAISSGDTTTVGVGGLMLGGGIGWMVRKYGLAIDNLVAAEVVTADGRVLRASAEENADLFWALRGGGGNFGVVTAFEIVARPVRKVHFGVITYPAAERVTVLKGWSDYMRTASEDVTSTVGMFPSFGEELPPLFITVCYAGDDPEAAAEALRPLLTLGTLMDQQVKPMAYAEILEPPGELPPGWLPRVKSSFAPTCSHDFIDVITENVVAFDNVFVEFRSLGGAVRRVAADATAFAHRDVEVMVNTVVLGAADDNRELEPRFQEFWQKLAPFTSGAYSNFLSQMDEQQIAAVYPPETYARLSAVKGKYDPENLFDQNPNIKPAAQPVAVA
ncbi:MAG: 6-hydroxy-D-nicotine oxidase [Sphaerisporangium sp.]|jgi:FAD/FMN-containing dehydrogenase|nr:6-hydroxy-D-nicotine oxidase [Sphaerisporangium sp.]